MSNNGPFGRYRDRVSRDADDIAGFFSTRVGQITGYSLLALIVVSGVIFIVTGWIG